MPSKPCVGDDALAWRTSTARQHPPPRGAIQESRDLKRVFTLKLPKKFCQLEAHYQAGIGVVL